MFSKEFSLKARLTKSKRLNFAITPISKIKTCSNEVEMNRNALVIVIDSVEKNDVITLESLIVKRISKECLTMFNTDVSMRKEKVDSVLFKTTFGPLKLFQHMSSLLVSGLSGDLHPHNLMIVMQIHTEGQTTYGVITPTKCAQWFTQGTIRQQPLYSSTITTQF